jgi:hypothetical protein
MGFGFLSVHVSTPPQLLWRRTRSRNAACFDLIEIFLRHRDAFPPYRLAVYR